jgi:transcriptional regulator with GAF, ATPase, and Fis domain
MLLLHPDCYRKAKSLRETMITVVRHLANSAALHVMHPRQRKPSGAVRNLHLDDLSRMACRMVETQVKRVASWHAPGLREQGRNETRDRLAEVIEAFDHSWKSCGRTLGRRAQDAWERARRVQVLALGP